MPRKFSRVQRLARREEGDIIKRIVVLSFLSVVIIVLIFTLGVPLLGNFADLLGRVFGSKSLGNLSQNQVLASPVLNSLPTATNSASLAVSGFASSGSKTEIFLNSDKVGEADVSDGKFKYENVSLKSGVNQINVKAVDSSGNESDSSETASVTLDTIAPKLSVNNPTDGQSFSGVSRITVEGTSDPNAEVLANGFLANVANDGKFDVSIPVSGGDNTIEVKAIDYAGNTTVVKVNIHTSS